jgi:hypothetical protein
MARFLRDWFSGDFRTIRSTSRQNQNVSDFWRICSFDIAHIVGFAQSCYHCYHSDGTYRRVSAYLHPEWGKKRYGTRRFYF